MAAMDSVLLTVPVSSPLHPQAILPCLQGYLKERGFAVKSIDSSLEFFWHMLGDDFDRSELAEFADDPIKVLKFYNDLETRLAESSSKYRDCRLGLRSIKLAYDRTDFGEINKAIYDAGANPFVDFFNQLIDRELAPHSPKIVGISITFQDQLVAAFTLARLLREKLPEAKLVLGGQMITRCYDALHGSEELKDFWDYLVLWEGEVPLLDIHETVINGKQVELINVLENGKPLQGVDRNQKAVPTQQLPVPDFSDIALDRYLFSELLIPLQTSRSCYGKCEFCAIPFGANTKFRGKPANVILEHMLKIKGHIRARHDRDAVFFKFMDDTSSPKDLRALAREIEAKELRICWETFARLDKSYADDEFMAQLYRGGCRKLCWGLESSDPDILVRMNKKNTATQSTRILNASAKAGILNFCFVLVGFPGETQEQRDSMANYIIGNPDIHVLTISTFDFTKFSPMHQKYVYPNQYKLRAGKAKGFEVRLPYMVDGPEDWKKMIVVEAQKMLLKIIKARPDIGLMSLFPDQIRMAFCDRYGNGWGRAFLDKYGDDNLRALIGGTENYLEAFKSGSTVDMAALPEPLQREHERVLEDLAAIKQAFARRQNYDTTRREQV